MTTTDDRRLSRTTTTTLLLLLILLVVRVVPCVRADAAAAAAAADSSSSSWKCSHHRPRGACTRSSSSTQSREATTEAAVTAARRVLGGIGGSGAGRWARNGGALAAFASSFSKPSGCGVGSSSRCRRRRGGCGGATRFLTRCRPRSSRGSDFLDPRRQRCFSSITDRRTEEDDATTNSIDPSQSAPSQEPSGHPLRGSSTSRNHHLLLAIVTEPDSCITEARLQQSMRALRQALRQVRRSGRDDDLSDTPKEDSQVDMVIVRLDDLTTTAGPPGADPVGYRRRVQQFVRTLVEWSTGASIGGGDGGDSPQFLVLLSSGLLVGDDPLLNDNSLVAMAHGVHVKESHRSLLPQLLRRFNHHHNSTTASEAERALIVVGMSCHSVESAVDAVQLHRPDYLLVGTCYPTLSHPEKSLPELEGPELPGIVRRELEQRMLKQVDDVSDDDGNPNDSQQQASPRCIPVVLGIGGINSYNCGRVIRGGADGVAVIRSVLADPDPANAVRRIVDEMRRMQVGVGLEMDSSKPAEEEQAR